MSEEDLTGLNTDQLIEQMKLDELSEATLMTPVDYSKIRPIEPQLVYYRIRSHKLKVHICSCGRKCIDVEEADAFFRSVYGPTKWPFGDTKEDA